MWMDGHGPRFPGHDGSTGGPQGSRDGLPDRHWDSDRSRDDDRPDLDRLRDVDRSRDDDRDHSRDGSMDRNMDRNMDDRFRNDRSRDDRSRDDRSRDDHSRDSRSRDDRSRDDRSRDDRSRDDRSRGDRPRDDRSRDDRSRDDRSRGDRLRGDRSRDDRSRDDRSRDDRSRDDRVRDDRSRDDRSRDDRSRDDRGRDDRSRDSRSRDDRSRDDRSRDDMYDNNRPWNNRSRDDWGRDADRREDKRPWEKSRWSPRSPVIVEDDDVEMEGGEPGSWDVWAMMASGNPFAPAGDKPKEDAFRQDKPNEMEMSKEKINPVTSADVKEGEMKPDMGKVEQKPGSGSEPMDFEGYSTTGKSGPADRDVAVHNLSSDVKFKDEFGKSGNRSPGQRPDSPIVIPDNDPVCDLTSDNEEEARKPDKPALAESLTVQNKSITEEPQLTKPPTEHQKEHSQDEPPQSSEPTGETGDSKLGHDDSQPDDSQVKEPDQDVSRPTDSQEMSKQPSDPFKDSEKPESDLHEESGKLESDQQKDSLEPESDGQKDSFQKFQSDSQENYRQENNPVQREFQQSSPEAVEVDSPVNKGSTQQVDSPPQNLSRQEEAMDEGPPQEPRPRSPSPSDSKTEPPRPEPEVERPCEGTQSATDTPVPGAGVVNNEMASGNDESCKETVPEPQEQPRSSPVEPSDVARRLESPQSDGSGDLREGCAFADGDGQANEGTDDSAMMEQENEQSGEDDHNDQDEDDGPMNED